jgi:hypothetical protein
LITREPHHPDGFEWRKRYVHAKNGRLQPAPIVAAHPCASSTSRSGALTQRDVKNEDRPDYVYENKRESDKMDDNLPGFLAENTQVSR